MGISKITRNFQVTLPPDVREIKDFHIGDKVLFVMNGGTVEVEKVGRDVIMEAAGIWAGEKETGVQYQRRVRKEWRKRPLSW